MATTARRSYEGPESVPEVERSPEIGDRLRIAAQVPVPLYWAQKEERSDAVIFEEAMRNIDRVGHDPRGRSRAPAPPDNAVQRQENIDGRIEDARSGR